MSAPIPFKRLILRAVLRNVNPMVIRLVAVPDFLDLAAFDDIFHAVLGWKSGIGYIRLRCNHSQRSLFFQMRPEQLEPLERDLPCAFRKSSQLLHV